MSRRVGVTASCGTLQLFLTFVLGIVPVCPECLSLLPGAIILCTIIVMLFYSIFK